MKKCEIIGEIGSDMLEFLNEKKPGIIDVITNKDVVMWNDRYEHISKHRYNFENIYDYDKYVELIPEIINNPDYLGIKEKDNSIQFIKQYDHNILIAVRITTNGQLSFRTMFPISDGQLENYISKNTAWKYK